MNLEEHPERLREILDYDQDTGAFKWRERIARTTKVGAAAGCADKRSGYVKVQMLGRQYMGHRLAFVWMTGRRPLVVDHINGDGLDNRWLNLREATTQQNARNAKRIAFNTTGEKNVTYEASCRGHKKYRVNFRVDGKLKYFGNFLTLDEAATRARAVRAELHGEFSRHA